MSKTLRHIFGMNRWHLIAVGLLVFLIAGSCSTKRQIIKEPLKEAKSTILLEELAKSELQFDWFSAKFSIEYIYDKKLTDFKGQIRIRKDSIIWLTFTPALGIEMARIKITESLVMGFR